MNTAILAAPACPCPDHPHLSLIPVGGGARGICPDDGRTCQMQAPEVTW